MSGSPAQAGAEGAHFVTAPADRIPFPRKVAYGMGAFVNNLLAAAIGGMLIILNLGLGMNPALVGLLGALPRAFDAMIDPVMGYVSDTTRSRWGRRRPYIFVGAITSGLALIALWSLPGGQGERFYFWWFLVGSLVFYVAYTVFAAPWVALGYELTPDYHERTRLMGVQNFIGQVAYLLSPWFLWVMTRTAWFDTAVEGARWLAVGIGVATIAIGVIPAIVLRERVRPADAVAAGERRSAMLRRNLAAFARGCATTLRSRPFLRLCTATFLVFNGFIMIASFQSYVIIYYVFGGDQQAGARYAGYAGTVSAVATFAAISIVTWLATRIGKRRAFFAAIAISMAGYALKWPCYDPARPWLLLLPPVLLAFGLGGLFTLMGSMIADVVDVDELATRERREGMYGSIFWWVVKVGMAAALAAGGFLLEATGFDVALGGAQSARTLFLMRLCDVLIPFVASGIAIWVIAGYPVTEARANEVRRELERRRGAVGVAPAVA